MNGMPLTSFPCLYLPSGSALGEGSATSCISSPSQENCSELHILYLFHVGVLHIGFDLPSPFLFSSRYIYPRKTYHRKFSRSRSRSRSPRRYPHCTYIYACEQNSISSFLPRHPCLSQVQVTQSLPLTSQKALEHTMTYWLTVNSNTHCVL